MSRYLLAGLMLLVSGKLFAYDFPIEILEYVDDVRIVAHINKKDISADRQWSPFEAAPPLSIKDALNAVEQQIKTGTDYQEVSLSGIELKRIPHHKAHWHYLVRINHRVDGEIRSHFFVVLMDGKVIPAIREPESVK